MYKCCTVHNIVEDENKYNTLNFHNDDNKSSSHHRPALNYLSIDVRLDVFPYGQAETNTNRPVIISRSDGSGVVRVGTLQAIIPSNNTPSDQEGIQIVPSTTHKS